MDKTTIERAWLIATEIVEEGLTGSVRDERLADRCRDTPDIESYVRRLLQAADRAPVLTCQERQEECDPSRSNTNVPESFERLGVIGRGGMGIVYKARQVSLNRIVALKELLYETHANQSDLERFRMEAQILARLKHPNIVPIYTVGEHEGHPYICMELIEGFSLARQTERFVGNPAAAARVMAQVAQAVYHANERGVLHRDLKPANILLDDKGQPYLTDFGLAKRIEGDQFLTETGMILGTLPYMSPEQAKATKTLTMRTDVYGLGAILYELLTGRPPFIGETPLDTLQQITEEEPIPPRRLRTEIPRELETVCLKCLEKDPSKRYPNALELALDLERWFRGEPISVRSAGVAGRLWQRCRRNPGAAYLVVVVLLIVCLSLLWAWRSFGMARDLEANLREEAMRSNTYAAKQVAGSILFQFQLFSTVVAEIAEDPEFHQVWKRGEEAVLQTYFERALQRYNADHPILGLVHQPTAPTFASLYVLNNKGQILARAPKRPPLALNFPDRDYFQGAMRHAAVGIRSKVHISRVYRSEADHLYKFAISIPFRTDPGPNAPVEGVVAVTLTTDSTLGLAQLHGRRRKVALVAPRDQSMVGLARARGAAGDPAGMPLDRVVFLHPAYLPGTEPVAFPVRKGQQVPQPTDGPELRMPATDQEFAATDRYEDPVGHHREEYGGRWLAGFAPIGNTEWMVVVQQRDSDAIEQSALGYREQPIVVATLTIFFLLTAGPFVARWILRRRQAIGKNALKPAGSG